MAQNQIILYTTENAVDKVVDVHDPLGLDSSLGVEDKGLLNPDDHA